jgi:predicted TIM-barrel fold metal-dependent hydrolase
VLYDVVGEPCRLELLAREYPDVSFIVPHLGSFADDWRAHVQVIDQLVRFPNVYADAAGCRRFDYLVEAIRRAGPRKLIFGSDGPWLHPAWSCARSACSDCALKLERKSKAAPFSG